MKKIGNIIKQARVRAHMTLTELAELVDSSASTLSVLENGQQKNPPAPADLVRISDSLRDTLMLVEYCDACPIRERIIIRKFPPLNSIVPGVIPAAVKTSQKCAEAAEAIQRMMSRLTNRNFAQDPEFEQMRDATILKIYESKRGLEIILDQLTTGGVVTDKELKVLERIHQQQCVDKGHHVEA
jgi:transcriptional regulator with XRE-family HTH domain